MIEIQGSLFDSDSTAIGHGVNIDGLMGSGIAKHFARLFPQMYMDYRALCNAKLLSPGQAHVAKAGTLTIYNIASQDRPGPSARLKWLTEGVEAAMHHASATGHSVLALPRIGCGIGGLNWDDVGPVLAEIDSRYTTELQIYII